MKTVYVVMETYRTFLDEFDGLPGVTTANEVFDTIEEAESYVEHLDDITNNPKGEYSYKIYPVELNVEAE